MRFFRLLFFVVFLQACSSIDSSPIEKFSKNAVELNRASESVLVEATKKVRAEEIETVASNPESELGPYTIVTEGDTWKLEPLPRYMGLARARGTLEEMNRSFEKYLELLLALSGSKITDSEKLVSEVKKINHPEYGLISTVAIKSFETFIKTKQEKHLRKAIKSNQPLVESFAKSGAELVRLINEKYRRSYAFSFRTYTKKWKAGDRRDILRNVFDLNDTFIKDFDGFHSIVLSYEQLPLQHKNIAKKNPDNSLMANLKGLSNEIKSAQKIKSDLESEKKE